MQKCRNGTTISKIADHAHRPGNNVFQRQADANAATSTKRTASRPILTDILGVNGRILITTRYRPVAPYMMAKRDILQVKPMTDSDAIQLCWRKLNVLADDTPLAVLAQTLGCMP